jgi:hypothetical protein
MEMLFRRRPTQQDLAFAHPQIMRIALIEFVARFERLFHDDRPAPKWAERQKELEKERATDYAPWRGINKLKPGEAVILHKSSNSLMMCGRGV